MPTILVSILVVLCAVMYCQQLILFLLRLDVELEILFFQCCKQTGKVSNLVNEFLFNNLVTSIEYDNISYISTYEVLDS